MSACKMTLIWDVMQGLKDLRTLCWAWRADADVAWDGGGRFYPGVSTVLRWILYTTLRP